MPKNLFMSSVMLALVSVSLFSFLASNKTTASIVVTYVIDASKDDAWSKVDDVKWDTDEYAISTTDIIAGCRWRIDIPKGAAILSANFICKAKNQIRGATTTVRIEVFDQDSCDDFDEIFWNWQVMSEYVDWRLPEQFLPNIWYTSPDIKSMTQAYINRPGYQIENYIGLRIKFQSGDPAGHEVWSWDFSPDFAAKLEIAYLPPEPPVADFSYTPENPLINELVTFNATTSRSPNGFIVTYSWNFGDATPIVNETNPTVFHNYTTVGFYNVTLTVTDSNGLTNSTTKTIKIRGFGQPVAAFAYWPEHPVVNETVTFNASSSYDPDGVIISYEWNFGDSTNATGIIVSHSYNSTGIYVVTLKVTDDDGMTDYKYEPISVSKHPIASFEYSPISPLVGELVTFNASTSTPNGGSLVTYMWDFGDNTWILETTPITIHTYLTHGDCNVTLNVTDSEGMWDIESKLIKVYAPPVASFSFYPPNPLITETIFFNATSSYDPDGSIVNYSWNFGDGNITVTSASVVTHIYTEYGSYSVTLTVVDNDGYSNSTLYVLSVNIHDIAILNVATSHTEVYIGQVVNITVTAKNKGTTAESFNVTVFRNETLIGTQLVSDLAADAEEVLNFYWNTSDIADTANFLIEAKADVVSGESDVADNTYVGDVVKVSKVSPSSFLLDWIWILPILIPPVLFFVVGILWKKRNASQKFRDFNFFDEITGGGIPDSFSVLIAGGPGSGKSVLCQRLTYKFLTREEPCVYVTYDCFPDEVRRNMEKFHWNLSQYENEGKFVFIDCFSSIAKVISREKYSVSQPFSLSDLGITMSKTTSEGADAPRMFLDSMVPLLTRIGPSRIVEFLQDRSARIKGINGTFIFTIGKETIEPNLISRLEEVVDCVIELEVSTSQGKTIRRLRIKKMRGRKASDKWIRFEIDSSKGIIFPV